MNAQAHEFGHISTFVSSRALPAFKARILVADESKDWRDEICRILQSLADRPVIIESLGASQAIQKARELAPEFVVIDIGLPNLNGIEAARQIRRESPNSKVVVLAQNSDAETIDWVLCYSCADACVVKADVASKLCSIITNALQ